MNKMLLSGLILLCACSETGEYEKLTGEVPAPKQVVNPLVVEEHNYLALLSPLNEDVSGPISGSANFKLDGDDLVAYIRLFNSLTGLVHEQRFYQASGCPTLEQDTNNDGYIDIQEANAFLGKPLFPLDYDLSSEEAQYDVYPGGDAAGGYWYEQIVDFNTLLEDLRAADNNIENDFEKISPEQELILNEGVVLILGVPAWKVLPETVASSGGYANFQTLPIACGALKKIYVVPGRIQGDVADPISNGEVGGSRGEYDDAPILLHADRKGENYGEEDS